VGAERSISIGRDAIGAIFATGDHARVFVGPYEPIAASYIKPWPIYEQPGLDRFAGREWLLDEFDGFLARHDSGYFLLEAGAGLGKTTFLAWLARRRGYVHHFVELALPGQEGIAAAARNLAAQLVRAWALDSDLVQGALPAAAMRPLFLPNILREAARARDERRPGEPIVLLIDGLDGADRLPGQNNLNLPRQLPARVYVLASQRPADVTMQVDGPRQVLRLAMEDAPNLEDMRLYVEQAAVRLGVADRATFVETLLERCHGLWIYLSCVMAEVERGRRTSLVLGKLPPSLWQYYAQHWRRCRDEHPDWDRVHLPLLATLGAATEELTFELLCTLAGIAPPSRRLLDEHWRPFLIISRDGKWRYRLNHESLRDFLHGRTEVAQLFEAEQAFVAELQDATFRAHGGIAARYLDAWGGLDAGLPGLRDPVVAALDDRYGLRHLTTHLATAGDSRLHRLLAAEWSDEVVTPGVRQRSRNAWHAAAESSGDSARYLDDVARAWRAAEMATARQVEGGEPASRLGLELRYALITVSVNSIAANVRPSLVKALVEKGIWTATQGLAYARRMPVPRWRAEALAAVAASIDEPARPGALGEAVAAARAISSGSARAEALAALPSNLPAPVREEALAAVRAVEHRPSRPRALAALACGLPEPGRSEVLREALGTARGLDDESARSTALASLAPFLPEPLLGEAVAAARTIGEGSSRVGVLATLAGGLPDPERAEVVGEALGTARGLDDESARSAALASLAPFLPEPVLGDVLATAWTTEPETRRTWMLASLAPHLPPSLLAGAVAAAEAMGDEGCRAQALQALGPYLPQLLLAEAIAAAHTIEHERWRVQTLVTLRRLIRGPARVRMLQAALAEARSIGDVRLQAQTLVGLAPGLPDPLLAEALSVVRASGPGPWLTEAVSALGPHLPAPLLREALDVVSGIGDWAAQARTLADLGRYGALRVPLRREAMIAVNNITDERARAEELSVLAPRLPESLLAEALATARTMSDEAARAEALAGLAPHLPASLLAEACAEAQLLGDEHRRARVLGALAPHLPRPLLDTVLTAARTLSKDDARAEALAAVAVHLPEPLAAEPLAEALAAVRTISEDARSDVLVALAPDLPESLLVEALAIARAIGEPRWRARALAGLGPFLPEPLLGEALDAAQTFEDEHHIVLALGALAPALPDSLLSEALRAARPARRDGLGRAQVLATLAPHLSEPLLADALAAARMMGFGPWRAHTLTALAPYLPELLLSEALAAATTIADEESRAQAIAALAPYLPEPLAAEAQVAARAIVDGSARALALTALIPSFGEPARAAALMDAGQAAWTVKNSARLAPTLGLLAPHLAEPDLEVVLDEVRSIGKGRRRAEALAALARHLSDALLAGAMGAARAIEEERWRAHALTALAPHLTPPLLPHALDGARTIQDPGDRATVLTALAGSLAECPPAVAVRALQATLPLLATRHRRDLLIDIQSLRAVFQSIGGEDAVREAARAITDVGRWWP